MLKDHIL